MHIRPVSVSLRATFVLVLVLERMRMDYFHLLHIFPFQEIVDKMARNEYLKVIRQDDKQVLLVSEPGPLVETLYYFYKDLVQKSSLESDRPVHPENMHVKVVNIRGLDGEAVIEEALGNPTGFERKLAKLMKYLKSDFPFIVGERKEWQVWHR